MRTLYEKVYRNGILIDSDIWDTDLDLVYIAKTHFEKMQNFSNTKISYTDNNHSVIVYSQPKDGDRYKEITLMSFNESETVNSHIERLKDRINWISRNLYAMSIEANAYKAERAQLEHEVIDLKVWMQS